VVAKPGCRTAKRPTAPGKRERRISSLAQRARQRSSKAACDSPSKRPQPPCRISAWQGRFCYSIGAGGSAAARGRGGGGSQGRSPRQARSDITCVPEGESQIACAPSRHTEKRSIRMLCRQRCRMGSAEMITDTAPHWAMLLPRRTKKALAPALNRQPSEVQPSLPSGLAPSAGSATAASCP